MSQVRSTLVPLPGADLRVRQNAHFLFCFLEGQSPETLGLRLRYLSTKKSCHPRCIGKRLPHLASAGGKFAPSCPHTRIIETAKVPIALSCKVQRTVPAFFFYPGDGGPPYVALRNRSHRLHGNALILVVRGKCTKRSLAALDRDHYNRGVPCATHGSYGNGSRSTLDRYIASTSIAWKRRAAKEITRLMHARERRVF